jgi:bifunctional ADP-heptose synthase (sugar kinase/adenylyltransferase)
MVIQKTENGYNVYEVVTSLTPELTEIETLNFRESVTLEMINERKSQLQQQIDYCNEIIAKSATLE